MDAPTLNPSTGDVDVPAGPDNVVTGLAQQRDAELAKVQMVRDLFYRARDARRPLLREWKKHYKTLNNKTWRGGGDGWEPRSEVPQIWPVCASLVAWMTDQRPNLQVMAGGQPFSPYHDFYDSLARDMNTLLEANFTVNDSDAEITKLLWDVVTYGIGWTRTEWRPTLADGLGDSTFTRRDPFTIYPDPHARTPKEMNHIVEAQIMTISDLDRAWPGAAKTLGQESYVEDSDEAPHTLDDQINSTAPRAIIAAPAPGGSAAFQKTTRMSGADIHNREDAVVTALYCWVRSHEATKTDDANVMKVREVWTLYVMAGNRILFEGTAEEVSGYTTHPYDRTVLFDTGEMYGPSLVNFMTSPQESINRIVSMIERNAMLVGNPIMAQNPRSPGAKQRMSNRPGNIVKMAPDDAKWIQPPQLHPQMSVSLIQYFEGKIESISGMSAIVRGFTPNGRNSTGVMDSVQDSAFVRVRATLRELERTLRGVTSKMSANIAEFYTEPRMMALIGPDGQRTRRALASRHFYSRDTDDRTPLRFTILADAGSQLLTSKSARAAEADTLFALGAVDTMEVLKAHQWPNWAVVAKRVMEQQANGTLPEAGKRERARA